MKIKRGLSDQEMFRGIEEEESFETAILSDDSRRLRRRGPAKVSDREEKPLLLPPEVQEKLNRCLLEVSIEWMKDKGGDMEWKVIREGTVITLKPSAFKKKG